MPRHLARRLDTRRRLRRVARALEGADAGNQPLAGESLASKRWSAQAEKQPRDSRILATRSLAAAESRQQRCRRHSSSVAAPLASTDRPTIARSPNVTHQAPVFSRSYASSGSKRRFKPSDRHACRPPANRNRARRSGGALPEMMRPFKFFAGGPLGSGRQFVSWIHRLDWIEIVRWIVQTPAVSGPVNATAPHPVTNRTSRAPSVTPCIAPACFRRSLRAEDRPRRVRQQRAHGAARAAGMRRGAWVSLPLSGDRAGVQGDLGE